MATHQSSSSTQAASPSKRSIRIAPRTRKGESAATAAVAGTLPSETLRTLDIEFEDEEEQTYGLLFLVRGGIDGIELDSAVDVSYAIGKSIHGVMAKEKLLGIKDQESDTLLAAIQFIRLRSRLIEGSSHPGPYLVKSTVPLDRDAMERYLRFLKPEERKEFLSKARIRL
jgi:hypothetical protein